MYYFSVTVFEGIMSITNESILIEKLRNIEESLLRSVLKQILGRDATTEDAKDLTKYYMDGEPNNYFLGYKGLKVGTVEMNFNTLNMPTFVFTPCSQSEIATPCENKDNTKVLW